MKLLFFITLILSTYISSAQNLAAIKMYCDSNFNLTTTMQNVDSTFYAVGNTGRTIDSTKAVLIKFDANFNMVWYKIYDGNLFDAFTGIKRIAANRLLLYGRTTSTSGITAQYGYGQPTNDDLLFFVTDTIGNIIYGANYGYGLSTYINDIEITNDGRILFIGHSYAHAGDFANNIKGLGVGGGFVACMDTALNKSGFDILILLYPIVVVT